MIFQCTFLDGRITVFDSGNLTDERALDLESYRQVPNLFTEFEIRADDIETNGIWVVVYWNGGLDDRRRSYTRRGNEVEPNDTRLKQVGRNEVGAIQLASRDEIQYLAKISVYIGGSEVTLFWRQMLLNGTSRLINGQRFANQELLCYTDSKTTSINSRTVAVYNYLSNALRDASQEQIADLMGFPYDALMDIVDREGLQLSGHADGSSLIEEPPGRDPSKGGDGEEGTDADFDPNEVDMARVGHPTYDERAEPERRPDIQTVDAANSAMKMTLDFIADPKPNLMVTSFEEFGDEDEEDEDEGDYDD